MYKTLDRQTEQIVAVKKIKMGSCAEAEYAINRTVLREIKLLQELQHENVIGLLDAFSHKSNVSLVFYLIDADLKIVIKSMSLVLRQSDVKAYTLMTLRGLEYLHMTYILHRSLKPNNLLVTSSGFLNPRPTGGGGLFRAPLSFSCDIF